MTKTTLAAELAEELRHDTNWTSEDASNWLGRRRDALLAALTTNPAAPADGLREALEWLVAQMRREQAIGVTGFEDWIGPATAALSEARSCCEAERERCAKIADAHADSLDRFTRGDGIGAISEKGAQRGAREVAKAIRGAD